MEALGDTETSTSDTPTSEIPTTSTPNPGTPIRDSPILDTPSDPAMGPGAGSREVTTPQSGEEAQEAGANGGDTGGDVQVTRGQGEDTGVSGGETARDGGEEAARGASGETGDSGGNTEAGTARGTGGGTEEGTRGEAAPAASGNTWHRVEPTWLQDEDDELWPEFPPCSYPEGATSPTSPMSSESPVSPTAGTTRDAGGSKRGSPVGEPWNKAAPGSAEQRLRPEGAGGRPRMGSWAQGRSVILEKFGGAAKGPAPHLQRVAGATTVKTMLLEWCRARTRGYPHVDVQNFSGSWGSGLAFCALLHSFFPDAFDFAALEPNARRDNFALAFATAEERVGCAPLLEVEDMVRLPVPDAKCVYTYVQELYRCLVAKGLVKTKKR